MHEARTYFEQVPIEVARQAAAREAALSASAPAWKQIAEAVSAEEDPAKMVALVAELNRVLEAEQRKPVLPIRPPS